MVCSITQGYFISLWSFLLGVQTLELYSDKPLKHTIVWNKNLETNAMSEELLKWFRTIKTSMYGEIW